MKKSAIDDDWPDTGATVTPIRRIWSYASLILIVAAIGAEMVSKRYAGVGMMTMARAAQAMNDAKQFEDAGMDDLAQVAADESARLKDIAFRNPYHSGYWGLVGLVLSLLAAGCWGISHCRNERGSPVWLSALFIFYVLLLMLIV
jgi:hypothetical protein